MGTLIWVFFGLQEAASPLEAPAGKDPEHPALVTDNTRQTVTDPSSGGQILEDILHRMDAVYGKLQSFQAEFHQVSETKTIQRTRRSSGNVYFKKPDKIRWSYRVPEKQEVYLLGEKVYVYLPGKNMVISQTLDEALSGMAPAQIFLGVKELSESFRIALASDEKQGKNSYCFKLVPKKRQGISVEEILLWISKEDLLPRKTESWDLLGNHTTLTFNHEKVNKKLNEKIFHFEIPKDAELVNNLY